MELNFLKLKDLHGTIGNILDLVHIILKIYSRVMGLYIIVNLRNSESRGKRALLLSIGIPVAIFGGINTINLLIDYLMFVKDYTSSIIHIVEKCPVQIEILFDLFAKEKIQKNNDSFSISISFLISTLFSRNTNERIDEKTEGYKAERLPETL